MAATLKNYDSPALLINSVADHVHILLRLSKNYALAKVVEEVKKQSSKWIKEIDRKNSLFAWQTGYGAFSVSSAEVEVVRKYIQNQETRHRRISYQEEVEEFMKEYGIIEYQDEYFWK